jgi:hypothetical protein
MPQRITMKTLLLMALFLAGCAAAPEKPKEPKIISVIGLGVCGKWMGGIAVTSDGKVHPSSDMTREQAVELIKPLPEGTSTVAMGPCISGGTDT